MAGDRGRLPGILLPSSPTIRGSQSKYWRQRDFRLNSVAETGGGEIPDWVILGLGVNVGVFPGDTDFPATSFRAEQWAATEVDFLESFCRHFMVWAGKWLEEGFAPIRKTWLQRCHGLGEEIEVRLDNETLKGVFTDLDEDGALVLKTADGERRITAGDVFFAEE